MILEEELLKKGFKAIGPATALGLGEEFSRIISENSKFFDTYFLSIYLTYKENTGNPCLYMMYYRYRTS